MKALSLAQPAAWAIFHGKDVENRSWWASYRGRVYIHASQKFDKWYHRWLIGNDNRLVTGGVPEWPWEYVHGAIIGEVDIVNCVTNSTSRWAEPGMYHFILANPALYDKPIPCKGRLGFFEPEFLEAKE